MRGDATDGASAANNGAIVEQYLYDAFGTPHYLNAAGQEVAATAIANRFLFGGQQYLGALGIYDLRNRAYHPGLGRFLQADPVRFGGGDRNLYAYCANDPVNGSDPSGLLAGNGLITIQPEQNGQAGGNYSPWSGFGADRVGSGPGWDGYWTYEGADGDFAGDWAWRDDHNTDTTVYSAAAGNYPGADTHHYTSAEFSSGEGGGSSGDGGGGGGGGSATEAPSVGAQIASGIFRAALNASGIGMGLLMSEEALEGTHVGTGGTVEAVTEIGFTLGLGGLTSFEEGAANLCFPAGTPVHTALGETAIESVRPGDWVLAQRQEGSPGQTEWRRVTRVFRRTAPEGLVDIAAGGETVRATPEHPFWVVGEGWRPAKDLRPGERLLTEAGREVRVEAVAAAAAGAGGTEVFNFEVEGLHTYFIGHQHLLVHNACGLGNPFVGRSAQEIESMFLEKGFSPRGPSPVTGRGGYVNPVNGRSYHIDPANSFNEPPHVDVNRPRTYVGPLSKKKYEY